MKLTNQNKRVGPEGIRSGFSNSDITYLNKVTNNNPRIQIINDAALEPAEPANRSYWCVTCKGELDYIKKMQAWHCTECMEYYDTQLTQDSVIKDPRDFKLTPYSELQYYPTMDANDMHTTFFESIDVNKEDDIETREHDDHRVQTIHLHNVTFADAITQNVLSAKKKDDAIS
ncbi:MAG: hypothetical protein WBL44_05275 [Nitrososphaeraceae archaeon]